MSDTKTPETRIINGSEIVVECLKEQGVDTVFGYPGGSILNIYDALYKHQDEITHILTSHEQGAAHAADGYARATGKVGVCLATSGPGATNLVTGIATLCVLGPVGYIIASAIGNVVTAINSFAGWLVPTLIGALLPFLVMTGTHHALTSIGINNRMTLGFDSFIYPGQLASNIAQGAAALALSLKTKNLNLKQMASANGITAVCGITEPVLFGVTMKYKTNLIAASIGGAVGGFFMGALGVKNFSGGSPGLLTLPSYIGLDYPMSNFYLACAGAAIAFVVSFAVSYVLYKDPVEEGDRS